MDPYLPLQSNLFTKGGLDSILVYFYAWIDSKCWNSHSWRGNRSPTTQSLWDRHWLPFQIYTGQHLRETGFKILWIPPRIPNRLEFLHPGKGMVCQGSHLLFFPYPWLVRYAIPLLYRIYIHLPYAGSSCLGRHTSIINPAIAGASKRKTNVLNAKILSLHDLTGIWLES